MDCARWYVARTHVRREVQTQVVLSGRGVEAYLPQILGRKKGPDGRRAPEPLFPGYLFTRLIVPSAEWLAARSAPGVKYFLGTRGGDCPVAVPDALLGEIAERCRVRLHPGWQPTFQRGQKVRICEGPMAGLEALFDGMLSPAGRSRVFVEFLTRLVPVEVEIGLLERAR